MTEGRIPAHGRFNRIRQTAPMCSLCTPLSAQSASAPYRCCPAESRSVYPVCFGLAPVRPESTLGPLESISQTASGSVQPFFALLTAESPIYFTMGHLCPIKIALSDGDPDPWGSGPHLIYGSFLWPILIHVPNGISIGSAVFAGLTIMTDRPTDMLLRV